MLTGLLASVKRERPLLAAFAACLAVFDKRRFYVRFADLAATYSPAS
jgi:hypothetical protein